MTHRKLGMSTSTSGYRVIDLRNAPGDGEVLAGIGLTAPARVGRRGR
jgi:hypothetical protein